MKLSMLTNLKALLSGELTETDLEAMLACEKKKNQRALFGNAANEDWSDLSLSDDPRFWERVAEARRKLKAGKCTQNEEI